MSRSPRDASPSSIRVRSRSSCSAISAAAETSCERRESPDPTRGDQVDRGGDAGQQLVRQRAELEPLGHHVGRGQQLVGPQRLEQGGVRDERAAVRAEELVGRAHQEVRAHRGDVGCGVRGVVHGVDVDERADLVRPRGDGRDRGSGAEEVGGRGERHEARPRGDLVERGQVELGGRRVEAQPPHGHAGPLGGLDPRAHVGVVVELAEDDLVAGRPRARQRARDVVRQRGGAAAVDHAARVTADEVGHGGAVAGDRVLGVALADQGRAALGQRTRQRADDGVADHPRGLGPAGVVEVGDARVERGEPGTEGGDVEGGHPRTQPDAQDAMCTTASPELTSGASVRPITMPSRLE